MKGPLSRTQLRKARRSLAANVRWHRLRRKLSQEELAAAAGLHRTYVSLIERVQNDPTFTVVLRLAAALRVKAPDLLRSRKWSAPGRRGPSVR